MVANEDEINEAAGPEIHLPVIVPGRVPVAENTCNAIMNTGIFKNSCTRTIPGISGEIV